MGLIASLLAAFGGGVFGSLIGGTTAFVFTGILTLVGIAISASGGGDVVLKQVAFGPFFGPHVAFVGGVAAAAYAGRKSNKLFMQDNSVDAFIVPDGEAAEQIAADKEIDTIKNVENINGADTTIPLFKTNDPVTLFIGGLFGIFGLSLNYLYSVVLKLPLDTVATTVFTFGVVCRLIFGKCGLTGVFPSNEKRFNFTGKGILFNAIWGFGLAAVVGYSVILLGVPSLGFSISAISLIFLYFGLAFPVSHHVSMVAGYAALAFNSVWIAGIFGILSVLAGEYVQRLLNTHVDTHLDMPATIIASFSFVIFLFH